jgi:hypothetical protein
MIDVSVDDRRALWALTDRHLRSKAFPAVLIVRHALRRHASIIRVSGRGDTLRVEDDGDPIDVDVECIESALARPSVSALHAVERERSTDLLVAVATADEASLWGPERHLVTVGGAVSAGSPPDRRAGTLANVVELQRPRGLRTDERAELRAWLPTPRARVVVDGTAIGTPNRLPPGALYPRTIHTRGGRGAIGFSLVDTVSRITVLARGVWVAQEQVRARGLPIVAIWDDDSLPPDPVSIISGVRGQVMGAADALLANLAGDFSTLPLALRRRVRGRLLLADRLPEAFIDVPLFDSARGPFSLSLGAIEARPGAWLGDRIGDVFVDDDSRAFLHRVLTGRVHDALPPPTRRLGFMVRQWLRARSGPGTGAGT